MVKIQVNSRGKAYSVNNKVLAANDKRPGKYQLFERIVDDNENEIGTVSGFFTDSNNNEYAVVCLDAQYRLDNNAYWDQSQASIPNLPIYDKIANALSATETATQNCNWIVAATTSGAVEFCRTKYFTIDGTTYYGQLPNLAELVEIVIHKTHINSLDPTLEDYPGVAVGGTKSLWSSTKYGVLYAYCINSLQVASAQINNTALNPLPILELPNS